MASIQIAPQESFEHAHSKESITELVSGKVRYFDGTVSRILTEGEALTVPANTKHKMENIGTEPAIIACYYKPEQ